MVFTNDTVTTRGPNGQDWPSVRVGIAVLDRALRFITVNDVMAELNGLPRLAHFGRSVEEVRPSISPAVLEALRHVIETGEPVEDVVLSSFDRPDVTDRVEFVVACYPTKDAHRNTDGVLVIVTDVTGPVGLASRVRRRARRAELLAEFHEAVANVLDEREIFKIAAERLVALDQDSCVISTLSDDGRHLEPVVVAAGRPEHAVFGREVIGHGREVLGEGVDSAVMLSGHALFEQDVSDDTRRRLVAAMPEQHRARAKDFALRSLIVVPLKIGDAPIGAMRLVRIGLDAPPLERDDLEYVEEVAERVAIAAERSRTHQALAETAATLGAVMRASPLATAVLDANDRVIVWNQAAEALFGYTEAEVVGKEPPFMATSPEEVAEMKRRTLKGEVISGHETRRMHKNGTLIDVELHASSFFDSEGFRGNVIRFADIRRRKQLEAELLQSQKIESVGRLAGGVAHDFNNILTAIIGYTDLGLADLSGGSLADAHRDLESIRASALRAAGLTQQLLAFSRRAVLVPEVVDANQIVASMESMLTRLIGEYIDLRIVLDPFAGRLRADPTQLQQVILNLVLNARDAMPAGGEVRIATGRTHFDEAVAAQHLELVPGDYVMISVSDTGSGMDEATKERIFEPFFTTKERGKGTGLGLATTYGIVRQSEGHIWVSSEVGRGTEFTLYFPASEDVLAEVQLIEPLEVGGRSESILLVEDEPALRDLARLVLTRHGYRLVVAANAADALEVVDAQPALAVDLLVTDVVMPGISGPELARILLGSMPSLRVLLVSGYSDEMISQAGSVPGAAFLAKPFTPDDLLRKVDEVLAEPPESELAGFGERATAD